MSMAVRNIYADPGSALAGERFSLLLETAAIKIERIVSNSHQSPTDTWYDQDEDEWVMVLRGSAALEFAGGEIVELREGDYVAIERHVKHRVARTGRQTIWLAVHIK